jgi:hypothetical protein
MGLTDEQVQEFRQHGFVAAPQFFDARETAAIQAEIGRLKREGYLRNVATDADGKSPSKSLQNLQLCPMYRLGARSSGPARLAALGLTEWPLPACAPTGLPADVFPARSARSAGYPCA